ncbi:MAG: chemotaxis protein CheA [Thermodesulfobacteriota bacterium]|nr:chemotaxis protein CheA [Thermodesulfobacteriota bacterium]
MTDISQTDEMQEILGDYLLESEELLEKIDQELVKLEDTPDNLELLDKIFRSIHTIKGTSGFLGFKKMIDLTHHIESVLNRLRKEDLYINTDIMDRLLKSVDLMKLILEDIRKNKDSNYDLSAIIDKLKAVIPDERKEEGSKEETPEKIKTDSITKNDSLDLYKEPNDSLKKQKTTLKKANNIIPKKDIIAHDQIHESIKNQRKNENAIEKTIRVNVNRLDDLMNLVGELVLGKNRLMQVTNQLESTLNGNETIDALSETCTQIGLATNGLQMAVMRTRLIPIGKIFNKFPRMIRDLARDSGKDIELVVTGEDTELDKAVVEEIGDPLVHLLRNSANHGIELPDEREIAGKPRRGTIFISAYHEGNHVIIRVKDDGRGMNEEILKAKAIQMGIITETGASSMTKSEALNLIFIPGLSTAEVVDNISGRGVGMDVVRNNIKKLNGLIELESYEGISFEIIIKIPLTLAIIQALLVKVGTEVFAIPLVSIVEIERIKLNQIKTIGKKENLRVRNNIIPLIRMHDLFGVPLSDNNKKSERLYVIIIGLAEKRIGLIVDSVIGQEEVVIKSIGEYLKDIKGIAGATILGDGHVTLIIDISTLMNLIASKQPAFSSNISN